MKLPRNWWTFGFCFAAVLNSAFDLSGVPVGFTQYFFSIPFDLGVIGLCLFHIGTCTQSVKNYGWKALFPLIICIITIPVGVLAGRQLFNLQFVVLQDRYEVVANSIYAGTYQLPLKPEDALLGLNAFTIERNGTIAAVEFLVVSHGSVGGHAGYMRVYDTEMNKTLQNGGKLPGGADWSWASPRGYGWYEFSD